MIASGPEEAEVAARLLLHEAGAGDVPHTGGSLLDHLRGVHGLLRGWGLPAHVTRAGLCHSLYGTVAFERPLLGLGQRAELAAAIGSEAERLVYCYGAATLRSWLCCGLAPAAAAIHDRFAGHVRTLAPDEVGDLLCIALADCLEQLPRRAGGSKQALSPEVRRFWDRVAARLGPPMQDAWRHTA